MNYWITTHWPGRIDSEDNTPWGIYLPNGREKAGVDLSIGDLVLLYQSKTGRPEMVISANGMCQIIGRKQGKEGIVVIAKVVGNLEASGSETPTKYADGSQIWWRWSAPTEAIITDSFVHRKDVNRILGYKAGNSLRGFGDCHSGLMKISKGVFDAFVELYNQNRHSVSLDKLSFSAKQFSSEGGGEESSEHLNLKEYVAANPSLVLNEEGIQWIATEYPFPTGDRADIVLQDRYGRFIGVEIEVDITAMQIEGLLQAVKYRFMVPIMKGSNLHETRAILIAYSISKEVKDLCIKYEVEYFEIDRKIVLEWLRI